MKIIIEILLSILIVNPVFSDSPPGWEEYDIISINKKFIAEIRIKNNTEKHLKKDSQKKQFILSIYELENESKIKKWSCDYYHTGYYGGILTDDGEKFIYIQDWYYNDSPVVFIYKKSNTIINLLGTFFKPYLEPIYKSYYHQHWLSRINKKYFVDQNVLVLKLLNNKTCYIDINTGELLKIE